MNRTLLICLVLFGLVVALPASTLAAKGGNDHGRCNAAAHNGDNPGKAGASAAFQGLADRADPDDIATYCESVVKPGGGPP